MRVCVWGSQCKAHLTRPSIMALGVSGRGGKG